MRARVGPAVMRRSDAFARGFLAHDLVTLRYAFCLAGNKGVQINRSLPRRNRGQFWLYCRRWLVVPHPFNEPKFPAQTRNHPAIARIVRAMLS